MLAVLPAEHPLAGQPSISLAELADDPFLLSGGGCEPFIRRLYQQQDLPLQPAHRVREMTTLLAMIRENLGVSIVPSLALSDTDDGTVTLPLRPSVLRSLLLAARSAEDLSPAAAAFLATIPRQDRQSPRRSPCPAARADRILPR
jgi:DNA-binding transcriptional LysR family regulator